jgi:hypothetical protein
MATNAQRKAVQAHRRRRRASGVARFEVAAPTRDKQLIRDIAKRLTQEDADTVRAQLAKALTPAADQSIGAIWRALRASPLVGADIEFPREKATMRKVEFD